MAGEATQANDPPVSSIAIYRGEVFASYADTLGGKFPSEPTLEVTLTKSTKSVRSSNEEIMASEPMTTEAESVNDNDATTS